jgi:hypothetical protein
MVQTVLSRGIQPGRLEIAQEYDPALFILTL